MQYKSTRLFAMFIIFGFVVGCGSDKKDDKPPQVSLNTSASVKENRTLTITATASDDNGISGYSWSQRSGPALTLSTSSAASTVITAPPVSADDSAVLRLTVTDSGGLTAFQDVTVNILNNKLPSVTLSPVSGAEKTTVAYKATAADSDGSVSSYSWTQTAGPTVTFTGGSTDTISFITPNVVANTALTFSVVVKDDDNESAATSNSVTVTQILTSYPINGTISGPAFAQSDLVATLAGKSFTGKAAANGTFSLILTADDDESNLFATLTSKSVTTNGLEYYVLIRDLSAAVLQQSKQTAAVKQQEVQVAAVNTVSINEVSTALYALIVEQNGGTVPADLDGFTLAEKALSPDALLEAAAVVKLLSAGGTYQLPEGVSNVLQLLTDTAAYNSFVTAVETATPGALTAAVAEILNDPVLTPPVVASTVPSSYYEVYPPANGFLSRDGTKFVFNQDGTGANITRVEAIPYTWTVADGLIQLAFSEHTGRSFFSEVQPGLLGLTEEQVNLLWHHNIFQVEARLQYISGTLQRIVSGEKVDTYRMTFEVINRMVPITIGAVVIDPPGTTTVGTRDQLLRNGDQLNAQVFTADTMPGKWAMGRFYTYQPAGMIGRSDTLLDILQVNADGTGNTDITGSTFNWQINSSGTFVADFADGTKLEAIKLDELDSDVQVFTTSYSNTGELLSANADYALKLDGSNFATYDFLNPAGKYWQTTINQWAKYSWDGNRMLWGEENGLIAYFGWQLLAAGTGYQMSGYSGAPPTFVPKFNQPLTWTAPVFADHTKLEIDRAPCFDDSSKSCNLRQWRLLKTKTGILGRRIYVQEINLSRQDSTAQISVIIAPRMNMYEEINVTYFNDTAGAKQVTTQLDSTTKGKPQRVILEPSTRQGTAL